MSQLQPTHTPNGAVSTVPTPDPDSVAYLRGSEQRAKKLRRYLTTITGTTKINVIVTDNIPTASAGPPPDGDGYIVKVTAREIPQPATDYDRETFDSACQHGLALHEGGHLLFTDFKVLTDALQEAVENQPPQVQQFAKDVFNAFEDGAIEELIRENFSDVAAKRLETVNLNLRADRLKSVSDTRRQNMTAPDAIQNAIMDIGVADSGITTKLTDEDNDHWQFANDTHKQLYNALLPVIRETHIKTITAPDAETRTAHILQCWEVIEATLFGDSTPEQPEQAGQESPQESGGQDTGGAENARDESGDNHDQSTGADQQSQSGDAGADSDASNTPEPNSQDASPDSNGSDCRTDHDDETDASEATATSEDSQGGDGSELAEEQLSTREAAPEEEFTSPHPNHLDDAAFQDGGPDIETRDDVDSNPKSRDDLEEQSEAAPSADGQSTSSESGSGGEDSPEQATDTESPGDSSPSEDTQAEDESRDKETGTPDGNSTDGEDDTSLENGQTSLSQFQSQATESSDTVGENGSDSDANDDSPRPSEAAEKTTEEADDPTAEETDDNDEPATTEEESLHTSSELSNEEFEEKESDTLESEKQQAAQRAESEQRARSTAEASVEAVDHDVDVMPSPTQTFDHTRWHTASEGAVPVTNSLIERLQNSKHNGNRRGTTSGRPDPSLLFNTASGNPNIMSRRTPGDEKEYRFVLILDRSASMKFGTGEAIKRAEEAVAQVAIALEACGVEVSIIDFYNDNIRILKPFEQSVKESRNRLLTAEAEGRTPLGKAVGVAKAQLDSYHEPGHIIAITDDDPTDTERYLTEVESSPYPIHGALIDLAQRQPSHDSRNRDLYDTSISVSSKDELRSKLIHLAERLALR
jgi:hypothetical protein